MTQRRLKKGPCDFYAIHSGSGNPNGCTPEVEEGFRGIRINAPREVIIGHRARDIFFNTFAKIIVAGLCQFEHQTLGLRGRWNLAIVIVAVNTRTKEVFSGTLQPELPGNWMPVGDPLSNSDLTAADHERLVVGEGWLIGNYFNPNLARDLALPPREAEYDVFATLGPYKSNVVHIKVSEAK